MKTRILTIVALGCFCASGLGQPVTGVETIINHKLYILHSELHDDGTLQNTSNIYIVRGINDTVWIFGCGYGDPSDGSDESDIHYYQKLVGQDKYAIRDALADATDVDMVIQSKFGFSPSTTVLVFITPHFHPDHINKEFVTAFFENLGYNIEPASILVHAGDFTGATCNDKCCDAGVCNKANYYYGSPFNDPWTSNYLDLFKVLGISLTDGCNKILKTISSSSGYWTLQHNKNLQLGGHTDGTLNLNNSSRKIRLQGSDPGTHCSVPPTYTVFPIHGNIPTLSPKFESDEESISETRVIIFSVYGNHQLLIELNEPLHNGTITMVNIFGQEVQAFHNINGNRIFKSAESWPAGIYAYQLTEGTKVIGKGAFVLP